MSREKFLDEPLNEVEDVRALLREQRRRLALGYTTVVRGGLELPIEGVIALCVIWLELHPNGPLAEE